MCRLCELAGGWCLSQMKRDMGELATAVDVKDWRSAHSAALRVARNELDLRLLYQRVIDVFSGGGSSSGWGMLYMVGAIYEIVGRNMLATQYVNCVLGAATAPLAYMMATEIFPNRTAARVSAILTAFFPSLVIWSCQGQIEFRRTGDWGS